jgi:hypothetical protein
MGAVFWLCVGRTTVCQQEFLSDFRDCYAMCGRPLSRRKTALPPSRLGQFPSPQGACSSSEFQARPVCQVGHRAELLQPSLCACASSHMTVAARALCRTYHQNLKNFYEFGVSNGRNFTVSTIVLAGCPVRISRGSMITDRAIK